MRLWIASHDYSKDVSVSRAAVDAVAKHYRKIRTTIRWLLGVLHDFFPNHNNSNNNNNNIVDLKTGYLAQHLLWFVGVAESEIRKDLDNFHFAGVVQRVAEFISELSSIHVESMKGLLIQSN
jgi:isoleucyl-tRNA synthetase